MGYYTRFEMKHSAKTGSKTDLEIEKFIRDNQEQFYGIDEDGRSTDNVKWYSHHEDFTELSEKFPKVVFQVDGEGEESGDVWRAYYKGGKFVVHQAEIKFPAYNAADLS